MINNKRFAKLFMRLAIILTYKQGSQTCKNAICDLNGIQSRMFTFALNNITVTVIDG